MEDIIVKILEVAVIAIAAAVSRYFIPMIRARVGSEKFDLIVKWAKTFVAAAENIFDEQGVGEKKLELVTNLLTEKANEIGIKINPEQTRAIIEAALSELKADGVIND